MAERKVQAVGFSGIPEDLDPRLKVLLEELQQAMDLREGRLAPGTDSRFVTIGDLVAAGVVVKGAIK